MPIIKIYPSKRKVSAIINYVSREGTVAEHLIETSGCSKEDAERDFKVIADYFNKTAGGGKSKLLPYDRQLQYNTGKNQPGRSAGHGCSVVQGYQD